MEFALNGKRCVVNPSEVAKLTLNEYIRFKTSFKGTKLSCAQGGCGACTVAVSYQTESGEVKTKTVPSCLMALPSVAGTSITTVEGLKKASTGDSKFLGHPVQERMVMYHGTQCGFCTPGMVMQMWGGLKQHGADGGKNLQEKKVEDLDLMAGNLCRCTGYRPISDCLKSFSSDSTVKFKDAKTGPYECKGNDPVFPSFLASSSRKGSEESKATMVILVFFKERLHAHSPRGMEYEVWSADKTVVSGHTGWGVYPELYALKAVGGGEKKSSLVVQVDAVQQMKNIQMDPKNNQLVIGAGVTLNELATFLSKIDSKDAAGICSHILLIAGHQVRNLGSIAGNLMMVRKKGFASDLATLLCAASGKVRYLDADKSDQEEDLLQFLKSSDKPCLMINVSISLTFDKSSTTNFISFRSAIRPRNAYSLINAALSYHIDAKTNKIDQATFVIGAVGTSPILAQKMGDAFIGHTVGDVEKSVVDALDASSLDEAFALFNEDEHKTYRMRVAQVYALRFAKAIVNKAQDGASQIHAKGSRHTKTSQYWELPEDSETNLHQAQKNKCDGELVSAGRSSHLYTNKTQGNSRFTDDEPIRPFTLHAAYVVIPTANSTFSGLDDTEAKAALGDDLVAVLQACDLKKSVYDFEANNAFKVPGHPATPEFSNEYVFLPAGTTSQYGSQPVGLVLATSYRLALIAANMVKLKDLTLKGKPTLDPRTAPQPDGYTPYDFFRGDKKKTDNMFDNPEELKEITGEFEKKSQYHFYIEPQTCTAFPDEDGGLVVNLACQGMDSPRTMISSYLGIPQNHIQMNARRVGGAFGGKASRCIPIAVLSKLDIVGMIRSWLLRIEIRKTCQICSATACDYRALVDEKTGKIKALKLKLHYAQGSTKDIGDIHIQLFANTIDSVYQIDNMFLRAYMKKTHDGPSTSVRGPGHFEAVLVIETIIDKIAGVCGLLPEKVREVNFLPHKKFLATQGVLDAGSYKTYNAVSNCIEHSRLRGLKGGIIPPALVEGNGFIPLWNRLVRESKYWERKAKIDEFNRTNKYRKRGIAITPARYGMIRSGGHGTEMGQGLHTKLGQTALGVLNKKLGVNITLDRIKFLNQNTHMYCHGAVTGGSTGSEMTCFAVEEACFKLAPKMAKFKKLAQKMAQEKGKEKYDWGDLCAAGYKGLTPFWKPDFSETGFYRPEIKDILYETYANLMFDCAPCLNPAIDMGQIEGAYVMGLGQILLEQRRHCKDTGKLLSVNTWSYKPPTMYDIPEEFHVNIVDMRKESSHNGWDYVMGAISNTVHSLGLFHNAFRKGSRSIKSSRATGEPPVLFSYAVLSALRNAILSTGRTHSGTLKMPIPATPELVSDIIWGEGQTLKGVVADLKEPAGEAPAVTADYQPGKVTTSSSRMGSLMPILFLAVCGPATYFYAKRTKIL
eukprot:jgi/Bigna1/80905/fgenesh1_pg.75_\